MLDFNNIVITKERNHKTGVIPVDKDFMEAFELDYTAFYNGKMTLTKFNEKYGFNIFSVLGYGKTDEGIDSNFTKNLFDSADITVDEKTYKSYKCFCGEPFGLNYKEQVLHGSTVSSWNCLMTKLNNPEYVLVFNLDNIKV